ncbi:FG-GAP repeat protein [Halorientalis persicus]|nr:FG-GAP repeat protein [Halorientalis persicus]
MKFLGASSTFTLAGCSQFSNSGSEANTDQPSDSNHTDTSQPQTSDNVTAPTQQLHKIIPSDGDRKDAFGEGVAISGDGTTAIIGADGDDDNGRNAGSTYVFMQREGGWKREDKLFGDESEGSLSFGASVAVSNDGSIALIGAPSESGPEGDRLGAAYVFVQTGGGWSQQAKLNVPGDGSEFGSRVAISGDGATALISASHASNSNGEYAGSAYIFSKEDGEWTQEAKLIANDGDGTDFFGTDVAISGDGTTAIIGASADEDPNGPRAGSTYVFVRENGSWTQRTKLTAPNGEMSDGFGTSVAVSGDGTTALIGANGEDNSNGENAGSTHVFSQENDGWTQETKLVAKNGTDDDSFGIAVAVSEDGTTAIIGSYTDAEPNGNYAGSAYAFSRVDENWTQQAKLVANDGSKNDRFGESVTVSNDGTIAIIGAYNADSPNGQFSGSAYVFK